MTLGWYSASPPKFCPNSQDYLHVYVHIHSYPSQNIWIAQHNCPSIPVIFSYFPDLSKILGWLCLLPPPPLTVSQNVVLTSPPPRMIFDGTVPPLGTSIPGICTYFPPSQDDTSDGYINQVKSNYIDNMIISNTSLSIHMMRTTFQPDCTSLKVSTTTTEMAVIRQPYRQRPRMFGSSLVTKRRKCAL